MKQVLFVLFCLLSASVFANIAWESNLKVRGSVAVDWNKSSAATSDGGMLYVWSDAHAGDRDLYAQRVNAQGIPVWSTPLVLDDKVGAQHHPVIQRTADGCFVVAWSDTYVYDAEQIYLQKINEIGQILWQDGGVCITNDSNRKSDVRLTPDAVGGVILTWTQDGNSGICSMGQSLSSGGSILWQEGGIDLTLEQYYTISSIAMDGTGGFVISYTSNYEVNSRVYLNRFNASGNSIWNTPVCIGNGTDMNRDGLMTLGNGVIYLLWTTYDNSNSFLRLQLFNLNGQAITTEPYQFTNEGTNYYMPQEFIYSPADNTAMISLISSVGSNLILQKVSASGLPLWGEGVLVDMNVSGYYTPQTTLWRSVTDGGCYLCWTHYGDNTAQPAIYAQRFNAAGNKLWGDSGVLLNINEGYDFMPALMLVNDHIWASWMDQRGSQRGVYYQILTLNGDPLLEIDGRSLISGLNTMYTEGIISVNRGNDTVIFWNDDRYGDNRSMIYMQIVHPNGTTGYSSGGIPATPDTEGEQFVVAAKVVSGDRIVLLWKERHSGYYDLYAQLLDSSGGRFWGENGIRLTYLEGGHVSNTSISETGGEFFIGWNHQNSTGLYYTSKIMMQKISGGQIQWEPSGRSLIQDAENCYNLLCDIKDNWLVYERRPLNQSSAPDIYVMRFEASDGTALPGWGPIGKSVEPGSEQNLSYDPFNSLKLRPEGLFVLFTEYSVEEGSRLMAQCFSPNGQVLLGQTATQVILPCESFRGKTECGENDFTVVWTDYQEDQTPTRLIRVGYDLTPLWDAITINNDGHSVYELRIERFPNDTVTIIWNNYGIPGPDHVNSNLKYRFVTPDGVLIGADTDYHISFKGRNAYSLSSTVIGNRVLVSWTDGPANENKDEPMEHTNLWAQMIINETTAIDDPTEVPSLTAELYQNYPNPFNPTTTIQYKLMAPTHTELTVYNLKGQMVRTLMNREVPEGVHTSVWDGLDAGGRGVASGVYFYRLRAGGEVLTGKMLLVK